jgi:hypothetical protein
MILGVFLKFLNGFLVKAMRMKIIALVFSSVKDSEDLLF